jgi:hypothetical protein
MVKTTKESMVHMDFLDTEQRIAGPAYRFSYLPSWRDAVIESIVSHLCDQSNDETTEAVKTFLNRLIDSEPIRLVDEDALRLTALNFREGYDAAVRIR